MGILNQLAFWKSRPARRRGASPVQAAIVAALETRRCPAVSYTLSSAGLLTVTGGSANEEIKIGGSTTNVVLEYEYQEVGGLGGGGAAFFNANQVKSVVVNGNGGRDTISVSDVRLPVDIYGGADADTLSGYAGYHKIHGGTGDDKITMMVDLDNVIAGDRSAMSLSSDYKSGNGTDTVTIKLDKEAFARRFVNPVVNKINAATYALQPLINRLNTKVPVLSKLDDSLTFAKVLEFSSSGNTSITKFLKAIDTFRHFGDINWTGSLTLGTYRIASGKSTVSAAVSTVSSGQLSTFDFSDRMKTLKSMGVSFPALESTSKFVGILFGNSVSLVEYSIPALTASYTYSKSWYIPTGVAGVSVKVNIAGSVSASAAMKVGLDSSGLQSGNLLNGFYLSGVAANLKASLTGTGSLMAGIPNVWEGAEAGAKGTVKGTLTFTIKDPNRDGKIRLNELSTSTFSGSVTKSGSITYTLGGFVSWKEPYVPAWPKLPYLRKYTEDWVFHTGTLSAG